MLAAVRGDVTRVISPATLYRAYKAGLRSLSISYASRIICSDVETTAKAVPIMQLDLNTYLLLLTFVMLGIVGVIALIPAKKG
jgi:hypothetical protein